MAEEKKQKRRRMRNEKREKNKFLEDGSALIKAALDAGNTTRSKIATATGLKLHEISKVFEENRELWSLYTVRRRSMLDMATDNIQDIIMDKNHPQNFAASKWVADKYKSELDRGVLESKEEDKLSVEIEGSGKSKAPVVSITFSKKKDSE